MAGVTVKVSGLRDLDRALGQLPKATARNVLKRTALKALQPMADTARQLVPSPGNSRGYATGNLQKSITVTTKKPVGADAGKTAFSQALREGSSRAEAGAALRAARAANPNAFAEAFMGPGRHPQAMFVEFGTEHMQPQPYVRPAFDANKESAVGIVRDELGTEIRKAVARLARKAARAR